MTKVRRDVRGLEIDLDEVPELVRRVAITIAFGAVDPSAEDSAWWNHLAVAREVIRTVEAYRDDAQTS